MEYIIFCDESDKQGKYFGNFYAGALVRSADWGDVVRTLEQMKSQLDLGEVKWSKVSERYLDKYLQMMSAFFDLVEQDKVKVRVMFTHNYVQPVGLTKDQKEHEYFLLYYQFIKHAFGLRYSNPGTGIIYLRLYFDQFPDTKEKAGRFKEYIHDLQLTEEFRNAHLSIRRSDITEVISHDHVILQCMDVVLGSMSFRLNDKHKEKPPGSRRRGKKTVAKEKLYNYINGRIRRMLPGFNIGISTGLRGDMTNSWGHPYSHWCFTPTNYKIVPELGKHKGK